MSLHLRSIAFGAVLLGAAGLASAQSDSCATATTVGTGTFFGSTTSATHDGASSCGETDTSNDVWYRYVASEAGDLHVTTCGSSFDTVVSLHSACPGSAANELDCNDD